MTTTWTKVDAKLDLFLNDPERTGGSQLFSVPLRIESWNWAQRMLCYHTPRKRRVVPKIDTGKRSIILPGDFYMVDSIYDSNREKWWRSMRRRPGDIRYTDEDLPEFWVWGNEMFLEDNVSYGSTDLTLYYWAYYPEVEYETVDNVTTVQGEQIHTPDWAELALVHLVTATCMMPGEVFAADINQYKIRIESGTPLHNPRAESAKYHLWWWNTIIDSFPPALGVGIEQ